MDALFLRLGGLSMVGFIFGLAILLADAFFLWCCCRVAGMADRTEDELLEHGKEVQEDE